MPFSRYMSIFFWFSMNRSESSVEITSLMPFFLLNPPNTFRKGFQRKKNDHVSDENCDFQVVFSVHVNVFHYNSLQIVSHNKIRVSFHFFSHENLESSQKAPSVKKKSYALYQKFRVADCFFGTCLCKRAEFIRLFSGSSCFHNFSSQSSQVWSLITMCMSILENLTIGFLGPEVPLRDMKKFFFFSCN